MRNKFRRIKLSKKAVLVLLLVSPLIFAGCIVVWQYFVVKNQTSADTSCPLKWSFVPPYKQTDRRWAGIPYGKDEHGNKAYVDGAGCGPTALAMAASWAKWDGSITPAVTAPFCLSHGYRIDGEGTDAGCFAEFASAYGLGITKVSADQAKTLLSGQWPVPIIMLVNNCENGKFTDGGHYIVLTKVNSDGSVSLNDPNKDITKDWENTIFSSPDNGGCAKNGYWYVRPPQS